MTEPGEQQTPITTVWVLTILVALLSGIAGMVGEFMLMGHRDSTVDRIAIEARMVTMETEEARDREEYQKDIADVRQTINAARAEISSLTVSLFGQPPRRTDR